MNTTLLEVMGSMIIPAPEDTTYTIAGKEFPVSFYTRVNGQLIPNVDIPMMSDFKWQLECLKDRLANPEKYRSIGEDVEAAITRLREWLAEHAER